MIRPAQISDFLAIAALDRVAWLQNRHADFIPDGEHVWRHWVEHSLVFVAEKEAEIAGAILAFPCMNGAYCVHKLFVAQANRKQGLGERLFQALLEALDARGASAFLTVDPANAHAVALYERLGFNERKYMEGYYRPHEHRFEMHRLAKQKTDK